MTDSYKPLTRDDGLSCCGVQGCPCYDHDAVRSAVEGLREDIRDLYRHFDKPSVWRASNDEVCDMCEEECLRLIDKWFPVFAKEGNDAEEVKE